MINEVRIGALDPQELIFYVTPSTTVPDLSAPHVTGATLSVERSDGTIVIWTCTITSQTATNITLTHPYVAGDIIAPKGTWKVFALLTVVGAANPVPTEPDQLFVIGPYDITNSNDCC